MVQTIDYYPKGTCSVRMVLQIEDTDDSIVDFQVVGGCPGNLQGIRRLIKGMNAKDVMEKLEETRCGVKNTSCPDQLSKAIALYFEKKEANHD